MSVCVCVCVRSSLRSRVIGPVSAFLTPSETASRPRLSVVTRMATFSPLLLPTSCVFLSLSQLYTYFTAARAFLKTGAAESVPVLRKFMHWIANCNAMPVEDSFGHHKSAWRMFILHGIPHISPFSFFCLVIIGVLSCI